mgnify:CR=1 FL=1
MCIRDSILPLKGYDSPEDEIESEVKKVFDTENDRAIIQKIIKEGLLKLETLHDYLEKEIQALG